MTKAVAEYVGPVAIRLSNAAVPTIYREDYPFELGKAVTLMDGEDATIISTGVMLADSLEAAEILTREGIKVRLLDMHTLKPIDEEAIISASKETGAIVTVEDSSIIGGLGGAVAEVVVENSRVPLRRVGIKDRFGQSGTVEELKEEYEISARHIVQAVRELIGKRKS
jgi:transketolase